ncbi:MAG: cytochrome c553 [Shewanella psychromarinicola]|jgi:cytochrome c553|uniref:c-type cytochrome n=1 Tax=Shewanella psychromarinicola TaxID=2487742 RepID=UPI003EEEEE33
MKPSYIGAIVIVLSSLMSITSYAADIEAGKIKSAACAGCHGPDGNSISGTWPNLAGQHASYLVKQLKNYKSGARVNATMQGMVGILATEADMEDVSAYYQTQKLKPVKFDDKLLLKGESIYRGGITDISVPACMACHGPSGSGNAAAAWPSLRGQQPEYIVSQLKMFRDGSRANDTGKMMRNVAARMSDAEMTAVAAYIAGIK